VQTASLLGEVSRKTVIDYISESAEKYGDHTAVTDRKSSLTYSELSEKIPVAAGYLKTIGIQRGDRVILEAVSDADYVIVYLALQYAGAVTAPVERGIKPELLSYLAEKTEAKLFVCHSAQSADSVKAVSYSDIVKGAESWNISAERCKRDNDSPSEIIFTTGTTGKPKACYHTIKNISANTDNTVEGMSMTHSDRVLIPLPLNHSFGMRVLRAVFEVGGTAVIQSGAVFYDAIKKSIEDNRCTAMVCVAATMESILREAGEEGVKAAFSGLRYIEFSAGAAPVYLREKLTELLPDTHIHNTWGSSESGGCVFIDVSERKDKITALGRSIGDTILEIWSDEKNDFIDGYGQENTGRLAIYGDMIFSGYWNQEELYSDSVRDGWLITKDMVWRDKDGYFYMLGRADDIINVGGEKVAPSEIEEIAVSVDGLGECACVGVKDTEGVLGQIPVLFYTEKNGRKVDIEALKGEFARRIGLMKAPRRFVKLDEIPRNYMKKKDYKLLKSEIWKKYEVRANA
jgi:long-chain acyl-CoA synthetase